MSFNLLLRMTPHVKSVCFSLALVFFSVNAKAEKQPASNHDTECPSWLQDNVGQLHSSNTLSLCKELAHKPVLIVNTASHCGFTPQFKGLDALYKRYRDQGLVVIGFPSNDFNQESQDEAEIAEVCYKNYGVSFLMTDPVKVKGPQAHKLFSFLAQQTQAPSWNFNKYLLSADGQTVQHFTSSVSPDSSLLNGAIKKLLSRSWQASR